MASYPITKKIMEQLADAIGHGAEAAVKQTKWSPELVALVVQPIAEAIAQVCNTANPGFNKNVFSQRIASRFRHARPLVGCAHYTPDADYVANATDYSGQAGPPWPGVLDRDLAIAVKNAMDLLNKKT